MQVVTQSLYKGFTTDGGNIIWAGALTLAWKQFKASFAKNKDIALASDKKQVQQALQKLNGCPFTAHDLDPASFYVRSGKGQQTLELINKQVSKKFPKKSFGVLQEKLEPTDIISYAYLAKSIPFKIKFSPLPKELEFNGKKSKFFGATNRDQRELVNSINYDDKDNFFIRIRAAKQTDNLYLIKSSKDMLIDDAIKMVCETEKKGNYYQSIRSADTFKMPVVKLDVKNDLSELIGIPILNKQLEGYFFAKIFEAIKLDIDESGAKVENEAFMVAMRGCCLNKDEPREYHLDKPFWVVMTEAGKHPYLAAYIKNPSDF